MADYVGSVTVGIKKTREAYRTEITVKDANKKSKPKIQDAENKTSIAENVAAQLQKSYKR